MDGANDIPGAAPLVTASAERARGGQAVSAEDLAWEGPGRQAPPSDVPVLRVAGFEGPLDWLLEQVRAHRVDLACLSILALIEQCMAALDQALLARRRAAAGGGMDPGTGPVVVALVPLQRLGDWLIMAAWLAWLRSRLLLPEDDPEAAAARAEAEALRRQLADRARARDTVAWLDARTPAQARRCSPAASTGEIARPGIERAVDLPALLRTYARLTGPLLRQERADTYHPRPIPLWRVPDGSHALQRLLPELLGIAAAPDGASLWSFLPDPEALEAVGLVPGAVLDPALLRRSAIASTLVAGLELARQGQLTLAQEEGFGAIHVYGGPGAVVAGAGDVPGSGS